MRSFVRPYCDTMFTDYYCSRYCVFHCFYYLDFSGIVSFINAVIFSLHRQFELARFYWWDSYRHSFAIIVIIVSCLCPASIDPTWLTDPVRRSFWVKSLVAKIQQQGVDGVNVDFEDVIEATDKDRRNGLTSLIDELASTLKKISPQYQVGQIAEVTFRMFGRCHKNEMWLL